MTQKTDEKAEEKSGRRIDLKPTQAAASGLAAVTVAILGSEFGWAGSVLGAGFASVVTTVASSLYQTTLDRTKESVKEKVVARTAPYPRKARQPGTRVQPPLLNQQGNLMQPPAVPRQGGPVRPPFPGAQPTQGAPRQGAPMHGAPTQGAPTQGRPQRTEVTLGDQQAKTFAAIDPTTILASQQTQVVRPVGAQGPTQALPGQRGGTQFGPGQPGPTQALHGQPPAEPTHVIGPPKKDKPRLRWPLILGMSAAAFLFGLLVLTGLEAIKGGSLLGDHPGTSVGRAVGYTPSNTPDPVDQQPAGNSPTDESTAPTDESATAPTDGSTAPTDESQTAPTDQQQTEEPQQPEQNEQPLVPQGGQAPAEQQGTTGNQ